MKEKARHQEDGLRARAESLLAQRGGSKVVAQADLMRTLHELQVHQIELELQNEALEEAHAQSRAALQQLEGFNDRLEELVAVRTADLVSAREVAEAASRAKTTFLAKMSHELRTPINAITGMTGIALRHAAEPKLIHQLTTIKTASQHLLGIINDILDLSQIEANQLVLATEGFQLSSVVANVVKMIAPQAAEKGIAFRVEVAPRLESLPLLGDVMHLTQILLNYASNAVKFTAEGSVRLRVLASEETASDIVLRFEMIDTGVGVNVEDQRRIFSAFEQGDQGLNRRFGGTGLGLTICRQLARLMGGDAGVESVLGQGSRFWFTVRVLKAGEPEREAPLSFMTGEEALLKSRFSGARVLLAEDDAVNQEVTKELLEEVGVRVDAVGNGVDAVDMARRHAYDLILLDVQMPRLDGLAATQEIRRIAGREHTPILALTASTFNEDRQKCIEAGMNAHIPKPVPPNRLFEVLLYWLSAK